MPPAFPIIMALMLTIKSAGKFRPSGGNEVMAQK
jgi:hypothetical protein